MSRDLTREVRQPSRNGAEVARLVDEVLGAREDEQPRPEPDPAPEPEPEPVPQAPRPTVRVAQMEARRDWVLARVALMLIDAAKLLDPITRIVMARILALASLGAAFGISLYAIRLTEGWQRVAVAGIFTALAALLIRKGQS